MTIVTFATAKKPPIAILRYLQKDSHNKDRTLAYDSLGMGTNEDVDTAWMAIRESYGKNSQVKLYECMLSFNPGDSTVKAQMSNDRILEYAREYIDAHAEGHEFAIYIHTDQMHKHAHVVFNSVHSETGKKFRNDKKALHNAFNLVQNLDQKYGLEVTLKPGDPGFTKALEPLSTGEIRIKDRDEFSYVWKSDLKERIIVAREISNSFEEFQENLASRGVTITQRGNAKTVAYDFICHDKKQRKARASTLGEDYERNTIERDIAVKVRQSEERYATQQLGPVVLEESSRTHEYDGRILDGSSPRGERISREVPRDETSNRKANEHDFIEYNSLERAANKYYERTWSENAHLRDGGPSTSNTVQDILGGDNEGDKRVHDRDAKRTVNEFNNVGVLRDIPGISPALDTDEVLKKEKENGRKIQQDFNARNVGVNEINDSRDFDALYKQHRQGLARVDLEHRGKSESRISAVKRGISEGFEHVAERLRRVAKEIRSIAQKLDSYIRPREIKLEIAIEEKERSLAKTISRGPSLGR